VTLFILWVILIGLAAYATSGFIGILLFGLAAAAGALGGWAYHKAAGR
jgi:hypothetical protein